MKSYCFFTNYYDSIVRGNGYSLEDEVDMIVDFIKKYSPESKYKKEILETACGTGVVAKELVDRGFDVIGMDISEDMIQKTKEKLDEGKCFIGDMTDFDIDKKFDVVLCNYNSICHLVGFKHWRKFFLQAYKHLKKGGILIFDINTLYEFECITKDYAQFFKFTDSESGRRDIVCLEMFKREYKNPELHFDDDKKKYFYEWLIKMFVEAQDGRFDLIEEVVQENSFEIEKITKELGCFGFEVVHLEDFHDGEIHKESERVYFVAKKVN